jgi:hypothetical protein
VLFTDLTIVGILPITARVVKKVSKITVQYQPTPAEQKTSTLEGAISIDSKAPAVKEKEGSPSAEGLPDIHVTVFPGFRSILDVVGSDNQNNYHNDQYCTDHDNCIEQG